MLHKNFSQDFTWQLKFFKQKIDSFEMKNVVYVFKLF